MLAGVGGVTSPIPIAHWHTDSPPPRPSRSRRVPTPSCEVVHCPLQCQCGVDVLCGFARALVLRTRQRWRRRRLRRYGRPTAAWLSSNQVAGSWNSDG